MIEDYAYALGDLCPQLLGCFDQAHVEVPSAPSVFVRASGIQLSKAQRKRDGDRPCPDRVDGGMGVPLRVDVAEPPLTPR